MASDSEPAQESVLRIFGDVDIATARSFGQQAETMLTHDERAELVLDLGDVTSWDSSGIEMLIQVRASSESRNGYAIPVSG